MPSHEAEILTRNAHQATGHVGAMPANSFEAGLMGDFDVKPKGIFESMPGTGTAPMAGLFGAETAAQPSVAELAGDEPKPTVDTAPDYIAETEAGNRPSPEVIGDVEPKVHELEETAPTSTPISADEVLEPSAIAAEPEARSCRAHRAAQG